MHTLKLQKWDKKHFELASFVAQWSKDIATKVGAVIYGSSGEVISIGYNDFPRGVNDDVMERRERPTKYLFTIHAEANAIANAARIGVSTEGASIAVQMFPCPQCMGLIIGAGIKKIVTCQPDFGHVTYGTQFQASLSMANEAGIDILFVEERTNSEL